MLFFQLIMTTKSDFMAAEEIKAILNGRDQAEQERIIRWVNESLGLSAVPKVIAPTGLPASTAPQPPSVTNAAAPSHWTPPAKKDIRSFVDEKKPKSDVQFAVVAAYFYRFAAPETERKDTIIAKDLDNAGRQARGYGFKKSLQTLNNARNLGYFDSAGRGEFKLNAVGENLVAMALPGTSSSANAAKVGSKRSKPSNGRANARGNTRRKVKSSTTQTAKKSKISAAGRAKIAAAQKARWAKLKNEKPAS
jgi:hypothetical protein